MNPPPPPDSPRSNPEPPRPIVRRRAPTPFKWLRRFLLLAGVLGIAGLAVMLLAYRFGNVETVAPAEKTQRIDTEEDIVTQGKNVDYVQNSGGEPVFRVRAENSYQNAEGQSWLEDVILDIYRQDGDIYSIVSKRARMNPDSGEAWLEGDVVITGWSDLKLTSRAIEVKENGRILMSPGTVEFRYPPDIVGRASHMMIDKVTDTVSLTKGVHVRSEGPEDQMLRLNAKRLIYKRGEGLLRAVGEVFLRQGQRELASHYLNIFLRQDGRTLKSLRARWNVRLHAWGTDDAGAPESYDVKAHVLEVVPAEKNPEARTLTLLGDNKGSARLEWLQGDGLGRVLKGRKIEVNTEGNRMRRLQGFGNPLEMNEFLNMAAGPHLLRRVCSGTLTAGFLPEGGIQQMYLKGNVEMQDMELHAGGAEEAVINMSSGSLQLTGPLVNLYTAQGDIEAPEIKYNRSTGLIQAKGGVQATLDAEAGVSLEDTPLSAAEGPVRVQSEEAHWTTAPPGFVFRGEVRAWRGQNLLMSDQLRGDETGREMSAAGGVKTVWVPRRRAPAGPDQDPARVAFTDGAPIEVQAANMAFRADKNVLAYTGSVRVNQEGRRLSCKELSVHMIPGTGNAERMVCDENVRFEDPKEGKKAEGDQAIFHVPESRVEIFGDKVRLIETEVQNELEGRYLFYDVKSGETRLSTRRPEPVGAGSQ